MNLAKFNRIVDEGEQMGLLVENDKTHPTNPEGVMVSHVEGGFFSVYTLDSFDWKTVINDLIKVSYQAGSCNGHGWN